MSGAMLRSIALLLLLSLPVAAKPPTVEAFVRLDRFNRQLLEKLQRLRDAEEFEKKPFPEQLLIRWDKGASSFKHVRKISGPDVLELIFKWEELAQEPSTDAAKRIMQKLPEVLKAKYGDVVTAFQPLDQSTSESAFVAFAEVREGAELVRSVF